MNTRGPFRYRSMGLVALSVLVLLPVPAPAQVLGRLDQLRDLSGEGCNTEPVADGPTLEFRPRGTTAWQRMSEQVGIEVNWDLRINRPVDALIKLDRGRFDGRLVLAPAVFTQCREDLFPYRASNAQVARYSVVSDATGSSGDLEVHVTSGWLYGELERGLLWIVTPHGRIPLQPSSTTEVVVGVSPQGDSTFVFVNAGRIVVNGETIGEGQLKRLPSGPAAAADLEAGWDEVIGFNFDDIWKSWWGRNRRWALPASALAVTAAVCATGIDCPFGGGATGSIPLVIVISF